MSEEIVACTGCGKKFRIPDGAAPSGQFDCTACGKPVRYGAAAKTTARGGGGSGGGRNKRSSRGARRHKGRQSAAGGRRSAAAAAEEPEQGGRRGRRGAATQEKSSNTGPILLAIGGGVLVIVILVLALSNSKNPQQPDVAAGDKATMEMTSGTLTADPNASSTEPASTTPDAPADTTPAEVPDPTTTEPEQPATGGDSGIGGAEAPEDKPKRRDTKYYWYLDDAKLFIEHESVDDTTPEQRAEYDELARVYTDMGSAIEGNRAHDKLVDIGKKAIPSLLSIFAGQTWETPEEQFAAFKVQQALRDIVKADLPKNKDLIARFNPSNPVPASHFKSAAKMWICHWLGHLQHQETFKQFDDTEEE